MRGQTLTAWARSGRRAWPEIVRVLAEAARGVAAAHASGRAHGPDHPVVARCLTVQAEVDVATGAPERALTSLERAVAIFDGHEGQQYGELEAHFEIARALLASGGDRSRAIAEARRARDGYRELGAAAAAKLAVVETWLEGQDL